MSMAKIGNRRRTRTGPQRPLVGAACYLYNKRSPKLVAPTGKSNPATSVLYFY